MSVFVMIGLRESGQKTWTDGRLQYFVKSFKKSPKHKIQKMLSNYQVSPIPDPSIYLVDKPGSRFDDRLIALKGHKEIKFI